MRMEQGPINILPFPSGMMLCMAVEGPGETPKAEGASLPDSGLLSPPEASLCEASPLPDPAPCNSQQHPGANGFFLHLPK